MKDRMPLFIQKNIRTFIYIAVSIVIIAVCLIQGAIIRKGKNSLPDQNLANRWSDSKKFAQVSLFYNGNVIIDSEYMDGMRENLKKSVADADYSDVKGRLFLDSYYGETERIYEGCKTGAFKTICVAGDFFEFHPLEMITGSAFSGTAYDALVLDEEAAWQLFGSNDIVGMNIYVGTIPFYVSGVCKHSEDDLHIAAGGGEAIVYMSYAAAADTGDKPQIKGYEVLMPNPVKNYAYNSVLDANETYEKDTVAVDNTSRFGYTSLYKVYKGRKYRAVRTDGMCYPLWENLARVEEDRLAPVAVWRTVLTSCLVAFWIVWLVVFIIRHKPNRQTVELILDKIRNKNKGGHTDE